MGKEKKERPVPVPCICGKAPISVCIRGGKMLTCPDPLNCSANIRTRWTKHMDSATAEWNLLVQNYRHIKRDKDENNRNSES
ncbi:MAG: hypothetical protein ACI3WQ_02965 [Faecousia sp.]